MSVMSFWTHGTAFQQQFTDGGVMNQVNGHALSDCLGYCAADAIYPASVPQGSNPPGGSFGAKWFNGKGGQANFYHISIPTPASNQSMLSTLTVIKLLYLINGAAALTNIFVNDGPNNIASFTPNQRPGVNASGFVGTNGYQGNAVGAGQPTTQNLFQFQEGQTQFTLPSSTVVNFGIDVVVAVNYGNNGALVAFVGAGADFDVVASG